MQQFRYKAKDRGGQVSTGTVEAESQSVAVAFLHEKGLWVTDMRPAAGAAGRAAPDRSIAKTLYRGVSDRDLALFFRQLATMIGAGMSMHEALTALALQNPSARLKKIAEEMSSHILAGGTLSEVMALHPWLFSRIQTRMIEAAETAGMLETILHRLADYMDREHDLRQTIRQRTLYPKILLFCLLFIPSIPTLVMDGFNPWIAELLSILLPVLLLVAALVFGGRLLLRQRSMSDLYDQIKLSLPVIGPLVRKLAIARFSRGLAAMYHAGVGIVEAIRIAGEGCGNVTLERKLQTVVPAVAAGESLAQSLESTRFFAPMFIGMVRTGEDSGNMDQMLEKAADYYEDEAKHAIIQLTVILGVVLLMLMAIVIAIKIIGFYTEHYGGVMGM